MDQLIHQACDLPPLTIKPYQSPMLRLHRLFIAVFGATVNLGAVSFAEPLAWEACDIGEMAFFGELTKGYERQYGTALDPAADNPADGHHTSSENAVAPNGACQLGSLGGAVASNTRFNPIAWGALVIIVHPDNPINDLSLPQLREIYDGRIVNWRQLGGEDQPLELQIRHSKRNGVGRDLRKLVFQDPDKAFIAAAVHPHTAPLEQTVENNPNALAVTGKNSATKYRVKILKLENKPPSYQNIRSGAYLLYRPLYIAYSLRSPLRPNVEKLIEYAHSREGRALIRTQGAVPYLDALNLVSQQNEQRRTGRGS